MCKIYFLEAISRIIGTSNAITFLFIGVCLRKIVVNFDFIIIEASQQFSTHIFHHQSQQK
jgi:hypothetical protein